MNDIAAALSTADAETLAGNSSGVLVRGIMIKEVGISYARKLFGDFLNAGVTLRVMEGTTYINFFSFEDLEEGDEFADEIRDRKNTKSSVGFAGDIGLSMNLSDLLTVGAVVKNIGSPSFEFKTPAAPYPQDRSIDDFELDPIFRVGAAFRPFGWLTLSADADLTKTDSGVLEGFDSQFVGAGAEVSLLGILKLRGGMYDNIAADEQDPVVTAGIGLNFALVAIDVAGAMSLDKEDISVGSDDDEEIPKAAGASASITVKF
ncbi:MAG: hypothetical protein A2Z34_01225 [Planctomycetes bacterium RBG_16_59_8]|nr:MAG: hypothetical protein A2Z34_01225 [Planctomycetes bacterium RBG_16_59_8]